MRYTPLGWAKKYEFTESDLKVACDMLDTWIDSVAMVLNYFYLKKIKLSFYIHVAAWPFFKNILIHRHCICNYFQGRTNLPPEKVPWDAIKTLLSQCIYGGKIDNEFDQVCNLSCIFMYTCIAECLIDSCIFTKAQVQL